MYTLVLKNEVSYFIKYTNDPSLPESAIMPKARLLLRKKNWHFLQVSTQRKTWNRSLYSFVNKLKEQQLLQFFCGTGHRQGRTKTRHNNGIPLCLEDRAKSSQTEELFFLQYAIRLLAERENNVLKRSPTLIDYLPRKEAP